MLLINAHSLWSWQPGTTEKIPESGLGEQVGFSSSRFFFYFLFLFLAELGLHCSAQAFSSCGEWGLLFVVVHGLLIAVASFVAEHGL